VTGSTGAVYLLVKAGGSWHCSCPGHIHRGRCKHASALNPVANRNQNAETFEHRRAS
jgi:uncharacterized Zn finger protein